MIIITIMKHLTILKRKVTKCRFIKDFPAERETGGRVLDFLIILQATVILCINLNTWFVNIVFLL